MWTDDRGIQIELDGKKTNGRQKEKMESDHSYTALGQTEAFVSGNGDEGSVLYCLCIAFT